LFGTDKIDTGTYTGTVVAFAQDLGTTLHGDASGATARAAVVTDFRDVIDAMLAPETDTNLPASVHLTRFEVEVDGSHVYHLVNTDYDDSANQVTPVGAGATLEVPVPPNFSGSPSVFLVAPGSLEPQTLSTVEGGTLTITLPSLDEWGILQVGTQHRSAPVVGVAHGRQPAHLR
jgi:hypothetical protein